MTVRLRSDRHPLFGPGFALLVFDRPIAVPRLDVSILNVVTGLYLGPSIPGRPSWGRQQTTFFPAIRAGGEGSTIFRVGPEITSYIQEGTYVEIASADGSVREELSWEGVLLRSSPAGTENWASQPEAFEIGPDGSAVDNARQTGTRELEKARSDEYASSRRRQQEEDRRRVEQAAAEARRRVGEERRRADEVAAAERARQEADRIQFERAAATFAKQRAEEEQRKQAEDEQRKRQSEEIAAAERVKQEEDRIRAGHAAAAKQRAEEEERRRADESAAAQAKQAAEDAEKLANEATAPREQDEAARRERQEAEWLRVEQEAVAAALAKQRAEAKVRRNVLAFATLAAIVIGGYVIYQAGYLCSRFQLSCVDTRNSDDRLAAIARPDHRASPSASPDPNAHSQPSKGSAQTSAAPNAADRNSARDNDVVAVSPLTYAERISSYSLAICNYLPEEKLSVVVALPSGYGDYIWTVYRRYTIARNRCEDFGPANSPPSSITSWFVPVAFVRAVIGEVNVTNPESETTIEPLSSEAGTFCVGSSMMKGEAAGDRCLPGLERPAKFWRVTLRSGKTKVDIKGQSAVSVTYSGSAGGETKSRRR